ncbi:hypothetical protein HASA104033_03815 [Halobacterium salinarum]|uniref:Uncharacterized protein n=4 Tax=Halobacterium salinarum TaxID=2242 RepID=Q9HRC3_HALSA|nr:hypothetical protein VNG_0762H [Halobacterium salinarum NRC-1]MBB6090079.1 hypothetical protein [Halobacterium salinarum]QCC44518.1 uncharacterized protein HBSAL_03970 [Halobacterium salinarum]CAP13504.1 uncharacterized protein OE_2123R [Halobacterium salinarum R1]DAC77939.1 TPA_inf: uncharacterized protein VNG_0762H [Halobacterium salinarum NRC-1]
MFTPLEAGASLPPNLTGWAVTVLGLALVVGWLAAFYR